MYHMERHYITTTDERRAGVWLALFGTDRLPVFAAKPRWQCVPGDAHQYAYDLDLAALPPTAVNRYAAWIAKRTGQTYGEVWAELASVVSVPIKATDCEVVETAQERPSLSLWDGLVRIVNSHAAAVPSLAEIKKITKLTVLATP